MNYMPPAQIKLHPNENFLHHAKIQPPCLVRSPVIPELRLHPLEYQIKKMSLHTVISEYFNT